MITNKNIIKLCDIIGHSLTLVGKPFQSLVVKYDHDFCIYSKLKDGSMRRLLAPLRL